MNLTSRDAVLVGHPVGRLDLSAGLDVVEKLLRARVHVRGLPTERSLASSVMATRREELTREAARLFAERGFHGTSMDALAQALGVQKGSLYSLTGSKQELLFETMRERRATRSTRRSTRCPEDAPAVERVREALRGHLRVVAEQLDVATVFTREWRYLEGEYRDEIVRRAPPVRGALARALPRGRRVRRPANGPRRRRRRRSSSCPRRTGRTRGSSPAATPTSSPTASPRSSSTASVATRRRRDAAPHRQPVRLRRGRAPARCGSGCASRRHRDHAHDRCGRGDGDRALGRRRRRDLRLRRRRHVQRGAERAREGRAARLSPGGRHERPSAGARSPAQSGEGRAADRRGEDAPYRGRTRERPPLRVQRRHRVRRGARPEGRRDRPPSRREAAR